MDEMSQKLACESGYSNSQQSMIKTPGFLTELSNYPSSSGKDQISQVSHQMRSQREVPSKSNNSNIS